MADSRLAQHAFLRTLATRRGLRYCTVGAAEADAVVD